MIPRQASLPRTSGWARSARLTQLGIWQPGIHTGASGFECALRGLEIANRVENRLEHADYADGCRPITPGTRSQKTND